MIYNPHENKWRMPEEMVASQTYSFLDVAE